MRKHCKLGAGLIVLSLVALLFWPAGEVCGHGHTIIYNRDDQMVTGFGGTEGIWSPTGDRVLTQTRIFGSRESSSSNCQWAVPRWAGWMKDISWQSAISSSPTVNSPIT